MRAAVGGTFNILHEGHKALLDRAFTEADEVLIGITSDEMASRSRERTIPFHLRKKAVEQYVSSKKGKWEIHEIFDIFGPAVTMDDLDILVVSEETEGNGSVVNDERISRGMRPLSLSVVPMVKSTQGNIIRASDIISGLCSRNGDREAIMISVGSTNPVKTEAVRSVMERIFGEVRIISVNADPGVPEQPWGEDTCIGAVNRARDSLGDSHLSVGIEAGVFEMYGGIYDIQHCAVMDRNGKVTIGMGSGFRYPDDVSQLLRDGLTVGDAMSRLYTGDGRGNKEGAIGILSKGLMDRKSLTEQSVLAAMIPRI